MMWNPGRGGASDVGLVWLGLSALFLGLVLAYQWATPLGEAPDEPAHLAYARAFLEAPILGSQAPPIPNRPTDLSYEFHQPPLTYALAAGWIRLLIERPQEALPELERSEDFDFISPPRRFVAAEDRRPGLSAARMTQVFWALILLASFVSIAVLGPKSEGEKAPCPWLRVAAFGFFLFAPQVLFSFAIFSNDAAVIALSSVALAVMLHGDRLGLAIFLSAFSLWAKASAAFLCVPWLAAFFLSSGLGFSLRPGFSPGRDLPCQEPRRSGFAGVPGRILGGMNAGILVGVGLGLVSLFWLWHYQSSRAAPAETGFSETASNETGYDETAPDETAHSGTEHADSVLTETPLAIAGWDLPAGQVADLFDPGWLLTLWGSFWAKLGWFNIALARPAYLFFLVPTALLVWGSVSALRRRDPRSLISLLAGASIFSLLVVFLVTIDWQPQGRLLLPALAAVAFLTDRGLQDLAGAWPASRRRMLAIMLLLGAFSMAGLGLHSLVAAYSP